MIDSHAKDTAFINSAILKDIQTEKFPAEDTNLPPVQIDMPTKSRGKKQTKTRFMTLII